MRWLLVSLGALLAACALAVSAASAASPKPIFWKNFRQPVEIEPTEVAINYGTGFASGNKLTEWEGWGSVSATASGVVHLNTCKPYCAAGNYKAYKGQVTLFKPRQCSGQRRYLDVKFAFANNKKAAWGSNCAGAQVVAP